MKSKMKIFVVGAALLFPSVALGNTPCAVIDEIKAHLNMMEYAVASGSVDQMREALLLDQPPHPHDSGGAVLRILERESLERQAVVDPFQSRADRSIRSSQELCVEVADGDDGRSIGQLSAKIVWSDALVEDVLGVRGEGVPEL